MTTDTDTATVEVVDALWSSAEQAAWKLPERLTVSEWADRYRILNARTSAEPGQWRTDRTPYLRGPMDTFSDPGVEHITLAFSTQVGKTETILNCIAYTIDQDPGPALAVKPRKEDAREFSEVFVRPMIESCPQLSKHIKGGSTLFENVVPDGAHRTMKIPFYELDRMNVYFGEAGSPAALASRPIRYLILDEVDKFPLWSGKEAAPRKLAKERTRTFWNRKILEASTPTLPTGPIWLAWELSLQKKFFVPCPHCGHYQLLLFPQICFPKDQRDPERIVDRRLAWYECEKCGERIEDRHKPQMLRQGVWIAPKYQQITADDYVIGECPPSRHVGFWLNCLYSPWLTWSEIAAEFLNSKDDPAELMNFTNSWLAEIWTETVEAAEEDELEQHKLDIGRGFVPDWAKVLTAGVDVQKEMFYVVIRAWGHGETSCLVDEFFIEGGTNDWDMLSSRLFSAEYPYRVSEWGSLRVLQAGIDARYRTSEVYDFCRSNPAAIPIMGEGHVAAVYAPSYREKYPDGRIMPGGLTVWRIQSDVVKEKIHRHLKIGIGQPGHWGLHQDVTDDYKSQFCSEQQIKSRPRTRTGLFRGAYKMVWVLKGTGLANHYLDCEMIATTIAMKLGVRTLPDDGPGPLRPRAPRQPQPRQSAGSSWLGNTEGWLK